MSKYESLKIELNLLSNLEYNNIFFTNNEKTLQKIEFLIQDKKEELQELKIEYLQQELKSTISSFEYNKYKYESVKNVKLLKKLIEKIKEVIL